MTPQVFTPSEQCTLYSSKVNYAIKCFKFTNVRYIPILFMCEWLWFGILESYAIKQFMCLTSMQLDEVVCNFKHYHQVIQVTYNLHMHKRFNPSICKFH